MVFIFIHQSGIVWKYYLVEEATKLIEKNNSAAVTSEASAVGGNDKVVSTDPSRSASDRSNLRATRATGLSFIDQDLMEPERQPAWKPSAATTYTIAATPVADSALSSTTPVIPIGKAVDSLKVYRGYPNETDAAHRTNSFGAKNSNLLSPPLLLSSEAAAKLASGGYLVSDSPRAHQSQPRGTRDWTANPGVFQSSDVDRPYSRRPAASTIKATPSSGPANLVQIDFFPCFSAQELSRLREENAKMKEENGALIRVISKLSKPT
ncbi:uncharacterized protein DEA37_0006466 [Paragonimus westermani]|uniref:cGMP-dependent protein kinase interacting domain-containing protein n=1 Tax=Paragonimus westermani TaxID=34504 RepID=A0A5J4NF76_9TREM|nr:uncharacterized protein DEA37_0006466 [Paragonimus westermani]